MKILHTSDWHLGKSLDGISRLNEQNIFLDEILNILEREKIDLILISGDIFDSPLPSAKAENMLYRYLKRYSDGGKRPIIIISGNHDSSEKLEALNSLSMDLGIIFIGNINTVIPEGRYGELNVVKSGRGFLNVELNEEKAVIITVPYLNDKSVFSNIEGEIEEISLQRNYSKDIGNLLNNLCLNFQDDSINIVVAHLFLQSGEPCDSERELLGGALLVNTEDLPSSPQYYALGHLHKAQNFKHKYSKLSYSGAPIKYSKSERNNKNSVNIVEVKKGIEAEVKREYLSNPKPIEIWTAYSPIEAIEICEKNKNRNCYVYFEIHCENFLERDLISNLKKIKKDIVEIKPCFNIEEMTIEETEDLNTKTMDEIFFDFYSYKTNRVPSKDLMDMFNEIMKEGELDEAN